MKNLGKRINDMTHEVDPRLINRTLKSAYLALGLFSVYAICVFLITAKDILVPFVFGVLLAFLIIQMTDFFNKKIVRWFAFSLSVFIIVFFFGISVWILNDQIQEIAIILPGYQIKMTELINSIFKNKFVVLVFGEVPKLREVFNHAIKDINISSLLGYFASLIKEVTGLFFWVIIFTIAVILEYRKFSEKVEKAFDRLRVNEIIHESVRDIKKYFFIKFCASLGLAFMSFWIFLYFGLDFIFFWVMLAFVLNFIPVIGAVITVGGPIILALMQFEGIETAFTILSLLIMVHIIIVYLEPKIASDNLNLSFIVILLSLLFWGYVWHAPGVFLCVPLTVMLNIIFAKNENTRWIAIMLSKDGKVPEISEKIIFSK